MFWNGVLSLISSAFWMVSTLLFMIILVFCAEKQKYRYIIGGLAAVIGVIAILVSMANSLLLISQS